MIGKIQPCMGRVNFGDGESVSVDSKGVRRYFGENPVLLSLRDSIDPATLAKLQEGGERLHPTLRSSCPLDLDGWRALNRRAWANFRMLFPQGRLPIPGRLPR